MLENTSNEDHSIEFYICVYNVLVKKKTIFYYYIIMDIKK